jgi:hypothetical protein
LTLLFLPSSAAAQQAAQQATKIPAQTQGANRGIELPDDNTSADNKSPANASRSKPTHAGRMPPFYWAAFELSGDWR